ncbi:MAG TPA: hypothetical protein VFL57_00570, partial [Bryobacteraceae bacterium]|nr:hypothetical protein [Bryobacteraceae bacterium]
PDNSILVGNIDPLFYLYTGRKAVRGFDADPYLLHYAADTKANPLGTPAEFRDSMLRQKATYLIMTPNEGYSEKKHLGQLVADLKQSWPEALEVVYEGSTPEYRVYRIHRELLAASR